MLIQGNCVKRITASSGGNLEVPAGKSYLVKGLQVEPSGSDTFLILRVDRKTVGAYRVGGKSGNHLSFYTEGNFKRNLFEFLTAHGVNMNIPVAEGQTFNVSRYAETGEVIILYDQFTAGDITADMPNGSASREFNFIQYMNNSATKAASGDLILDESNSPAEFPNFPCDAVVPAKHKIDILGLVGHPVGHKTTGDNYILSTFVKLIKDRETLFDEDRAGILFRAKKPSEDKTMYRMDFSLIGASVMSHYSQADELASDPYMFDPPLHFESGEELLVYVTFELTGSDTLLADTVDLAAIMNVKLD
jgi:hypothetical protein